ncbi:unnamed protein product [Ceratitis capitata]|uniref:(Mediterranean fruit fly) hypothetical protein n=1 Tax=Ceratitis capitata TaxID=7213 RepID=A0A811UDA5_CERCA|nr:unnamed protein product [Ceratitis capitata]
MSIIKRYKQCRSYRFAFKSNRRVFDVPITNLSCFEVFVESTHTENLAIVAPDVGAIGRARAFAKTLEKEHKIKLSDEIIIIDKYREKAGTSQVMNIIGEVTSKNCVIVDDIVDSGGTLCNAASALKSYGARSEIKMPIKSTEDVITSLIEFVNKRKVTITQEEMLKIAQLVRIKLSNDEIEHYSKELTMLNWIHDTLLQVNTEGVSPVRYGAIDKVIHVHDDVVDSQNKEKKYYPTQNLNMDIL